MFVVDVLDVVVVGGENGGIRAVRWSRKFVTQTKMIHHGQYMPPVYTGCTLPSLPALYSTIMHIGHVVLVGNESPEFGPTFLTIDI